MNFIEKEKLIKADIVSIENRVRHAFNQGYDLGFKDGKKAKPQDIDYKAQYERISQKAEIVISQLRADRDRLMSLTSVTPIRPKGHWIDTKENSTNTRGQIIHEVICSECNGIAYFRSIGNKYIGANICPNCGADMREVEE